MLYSEPCAFIKNNGFFSDKFYIFRGVRQGCSLSSLLFILCMEVLSQHINQNNRIKGLSFDRENRHIKVIQYADDTTIFLKNTRDSKNAIESLELFGQIAGTELIYQNVKVYGLALINISNYISVFTSGFGSDMRCAPHFRQH